MHDKLLDVNITLHLVRLKIETDKGHIRHCLLFCFHKKSGADAYRIIIEIYNGNVIAIRTCVNWIKRLKNGNFDISNKSALNALQLWKGTNCAKMGKSHGKRWINLYCIDFFIVIKKIAKNRQELSHHSNISIKILYLLWKTFFSLFILFTSFFIYYIVYTHCLKKWRSFIYLLIIYLLRLS